MEKNSVSILPITGASRLPCSPKDKGKEIVLENILFYDPRRVPPPEIEVIGRDCVRLVKGKRQKVERPAVILSSRQLDHIKDAARLISEEDANKRIEEEATNRKKRMEEQDKRKETFQAIEEHRKKVFDREALRRLREWPPKALTPHQASSKQEQRLFNLQLEADEEVRRMRALVLQAKCDAIREAQILEKQHIRKLEEEETIKHVHEMEKLREIGLQEERKKDDLRRELYALNALRLRQQIKEKFTGRREQISQKYEEGAFAAMQDAQFRKENEEEKLKEKLKKEKKKQEATNQIMETKKKMEEMLTQEKYLDYKARLEQQNMDKETAQKIQEEKRNKKFKSQLQEIWLQEKEREILEATRRAELKWQRQQEEIERKWRNHVLEEAREKVERNKSLCKEWKLQVEEGKRNKLMTAINEKRSQCGPQKEWKEIGEPEKITDKKKQEKAIRLREGYLEQMRDQKKQRAQDARLEQRRLKDKQEDDKRKELALEALKKDTIADLRKIALPERLVKDLEVKLKIHEKSPPENEKRQKEK